MSPRVRVAAQGGRKAGFRLSVSSRPPACACDAWAPELAPSHALRRLLRLGAVSWRGFRAAYRTELSAPPAQEALKPLALLARRRTVAVLCDCRQRRRCHHQALADALERCRRAGRFTLSRSREAVP